MDTNKIFTDTVSGTIAEQSQGVKVEPNPLNIFIWGILGFLIFVVLYILIIKITGKIVRKTKENNLENEY